jgi:hypothetical protein
MATKANPDQRLMLLGKSITWDDIRRNIELLITHRRSWDDLKNTCFRDFRKPLTYWIKEDWGHKLVDKYLQTWAMRYYDIVSRQTNDVLDRDSKTSPHQFWMQIRLMSELPISVRHKVLAMWNAKGGGSLYELVEIVQRELDKLFKPPLNYNRPPTTQNSSPPET